MTIDVDRLNRLIEATQRDPRVADASPGGWSVIRARAAAGLAGVQRTKGAHMQTGDDEIHRFAIIGATQQLAELERQADELRDLIRQLSGRSARATIGASNGHTPSSKSGSLHRPSVQPAGSGKSGKKSRDSEAAEKTVRFVESRGPVTSRDVANEFGIPSAAATARLHRALKAGLIKRGGRGIYKKA